MAWRVKALVFKHDDLSPISRGHMVGGETRLLKVWTQTKGLLCAIIDPFKVIYKDMASLQHKNESTPGVPPLKIQLIHKLTWTEK